MQQATSSMLLRDVWSSGPAESVAVSEIGEGGSDIERFSYGFLRRRSEAIELLLGPALPATGCIALLVLPRGALQICVVSALLRTGRVTICQVQSQLPLSQLVRVVKTFSGADLRIVSAGQAGARLLMLRSELAAAAESVGAALDLLLLEPFLEGREQEHSYSQNFGRRDCGHVEPLVDPFVLLTSGSRRLKAVLLPESAIVMRCRWAMGPPLELGVSSRGGCERSLYAHRAPLSFVDALGEVWPSLLAGGEVAVCPENEGGAGFWPWLAASRSTHCTVVPVLLDEIDLHRVSLPRLRFVISSGDVLRRRTMDRFAAQFPWVQIISLYGLTECAGDCLVWERPMGPSGSPACLNDNIVPLGSALPGVVALVLPADELPSQTSAGCPHRAVGCMWISGSLLARGYWSMHGPVESLPENACSSSDSDGTYFVKVDGVFWLRTGDMAWRDAEGLHFAGRNGDMMLKVCGLKVWAEQLREAILARLHKNENVDSVSCSANVKPDVCNDILVTDDEAAGLYADEQQPLTKRSRSRVDVTSLQNPTSEDRALLVLRQAALRGGSVGGLAASSRLTEETELLICGRQKLCPGDCKGEEVVVFVGGSVPVSPSRLRGICQDALLETLGASHSIAAPLPLNIVRMPQGCKVPRLANLKPDWRSLAQIWLDAANRAAVNCSVEIAPTGTSGLVGDSPSILHAVLAMAGRLAGDRQVREDDDLVREWGFSSLLLGRLVVCLNDALGTQLTLSVLLKRAKPELVSSLMCTPRDIASLLQDSTFNAATNTAAVIGDSSLLRAQSAQTSHVNRIVEVAFTKPVEDPPIDCIWSVHLGKCVDAPILVLHAQSDGSTPDVLVIAGSVGGAVACAGLCGRVLWTRHVHDRIVARCAGLELDADRYVLVPTWGGLLYCLGLLTGALIWVSSLGAKSRSGAIVAQGAVWVATYEGSVHRLDPVTGRPFAKPRRVHRSGVSDICEVAGRIVVVCLNGLVVCLEADEAGAVVWRADLGCTAFRAPLVFVAPDQGCGGGVGLLFGCVMGTIALRASDGSLLWWRSSAEVHMPLFELEAGIVLALNCSGHAAALRVGDGQPVCRELELKGCPCAVVATGGMAIISLKATSTTEEASDEGAANMLLGVCLCSAGDSEAAPHFVERWRLPIASLLPHRSTTQCHALHSLPGGRLLLGARDDFLHALSCRQ